MLSDALTYYERGVNFKTNEAEAKTNLSKIYLALKEHKKIINLWRQLPENYIDAYHLGLACFQNSIALLNEGDEKGANALFDDAIFYFRTALTFNSNDEISRFFLEKVLLRSKQVSDSSRQKYSDFHFYKSNYLKNKGFIVENKSHGDTTGLFFATKK